MGDDRYKARQELNILQEANLSSGIGLHGMGRCGMGLHGMGLCGMGLCEIQRDEAG